MEKYLEIGEIINTHGIKGELKVIPLTDDPKRYEKLEWVYVDKSGILERYNVERVKYFKGVILLKFKEINDIIQAERLKGLFIKVDRNNAIQLPKDSFFICDLIGCQVFDADGKKLGQIKEVIKTGSNDVFVVSDKSGREILIPAMKSIVNEISVEEGKMFVTLPEGLVEDEI